MTNDSEHPGTGGRGIDGGSAVDAAGDRDGAAMGGATGGAPDGARDGTTDSRDGGDADLGTDRTDSSDLRIDASLPDDARFDATAEAFQPICAACSSSSWGPPVANGPSPAALVELSGLAASRVHPGLLYSHNDSGDTARFFALTEQAQVAAEVHLTGATATDWEDISVGPCPAGSCVFIGDTGDNHLDRTQYVIHRVAEPPTLPSDGSVISVTYESFPFVYPDGPHNAEALLVHPTTGQVFVILKESGLPAAVYEMPLPLQADQEVTLRLLTTLAISPVNGAVTDGAFHPCGDRILVRTTSATGLFELSRAPGASLATLFSAAPVVVPVADEPQGEAVTYALDGRRYFTASETVSGSPVPSLSMVTCQSP